MHFVHCEIFNIKHGNINQRCNKCELYNNLLNAPSRMCTLYIVRYLMKNFGISLKSAKMVLSAYMFEIYHMDSSKNVFRKVFFKN